MNINKSFLISLIVNITVILIPINNAIKEINSNSEVVTVKLNSSNNLSSNDNNKENLSEDLQSNNNNAQNIEKNSNLVNENQTKNKINDNSEQIKNINKRNIDDDKIIIEKQENNSNVGNSTSSSSENDNISSKNFSSYSGDVNSNAGNSEYNKSNGVIGSNKGNKGDITNICRENIDFKVSYKQELEYPLSAIRMGDIGDVKVNLRLSVNSNGTVNILSISGGTKIFQDEAKRATRNIKIELLNPESVKCILNKSFIFKKK